ncbi:DYH1B, partial [Symbiodinium sp. KB8]
PLRIDPYSEAEWEKAKAAFDEALSPAERSVASKLQAEIAKLTDRPVQLLREFDRFRNLFGRPTIAKQLVKERETLLAQLSGMVDAMEAKLETRMNEMGTSSAPYAPGLSPTLDKVVWGHSLRAK